ncbi:MAG: hypothetical protein J4F42_07685 [Desulfurellaceae bacterium]|nr:hypothetical protein [Desulfurellaceae bacterium]
MILLDTDILVAIALDRHPHAGPAADLIVAPSHGGGSAGDFLFDLTRFVPVAATSTEAFRHAAALPIADFEDALQVAAARACGARFIVARNVRD